MKKTELPRNKSFDDLSYMEDPGMKYSDLEDDNDNFEYIEDGCFYLENMLEAEERIRDISEVKKKLIVDPDSMTKIERKELKEYFVEYANAFFDERIHNAKVLKDIEDIPCTVKGLNIILSALVREGINPI